MDGDVTYWRAGNGWCFAVETVVTPGWTMVTGCETDGCEEISKEEYDEFMAWRKKESDAALETFERAKAAMVAALEEEQERTKRENTAVIDALKDLGLDDAMVEILRGRLL